MRAVVQRVAEASVTVDGEIVGEIQRGLLVLLGVAGEDTEQDAVWLSEKVSHLRIFPDHDDKMNLALHEIGGEMLVVSQFTLFGDCRKGRRPSFIQAAGAEQGNALYELFVSLVRGRGITVATGRFQASMQVRLLNDGPVTLLLDSTRTF